MSTMSTPETRNPFARALWLCMAGAMIFLAVSAGITSSKNQAVSGDSRIDWPTRFVQTLLRLDPRMGRSILCQGIPLLAREDNEDNMDPMYRAGMVQLFFQWTLDIRYPSPQEIFRAQMPLIGWRIAYQFPTPETPVQPGPVATTASVETPIAPDSGSTRIITDGPGPEVFIYHTHTSECYIPISGVEHRLNQCGDIVGVGRRLSEDLERVGIPTIHSEAVHDQYPFRDSYLRSQKTIIETLESHPSLSVVLDVHRDGAVDFERGVQVDGQRAARIVFVVGSDRMGLPHPHWQRNYQFATDLADILNQRHPGLVGRIIVSDARYNQHLHDHAIIVEIGDQNTTMEEANRSADLLAQAIREYLNRNRNSSGETPQHEERRPSVVETTTSPGTSIR